MITFHQADNHAPFPHRFIETTPVINRYGEVIRESCTFVVCSFCNHDVNRPMLVGEVSKCNCVAGCHTEARPQTVTISLYKNLTFGGMMGS